MQHIDIQPIRLSDSAPLAAPQTLLAKMLLAANLLMLTSIPSSAPSPASPPLLRDDARQTLRADYVRTLLQQSLLLPCTPDDLLPEGLAKVTALRAAHMQKDAALYVQRDVAAALVPQNDTADARFWIGMGPDAPPAYIIVNEAAHRWDPAYVRAHIMTSDATLTALFHQAGVRSTAHYLTPEERASQPERAEKIDAVTRIVEIMARRMRLAQKPALYVWPGLGMGESLVSKEGRAYLFVDPDYLDLLPNPLLADILGHEEAHLQHGDNSAQGLARRHNDPAWKYQTELRADRDGTGVNGGRDPDLLAFFFQGQLDAEIHHYNVLHPHAELRTPAQQSAFDAAAMQPYPSFETRIAALRRQASDIGPDTHGNER